MKWPYRMRALLKEELGPHRTDSLNEVRSTCAVPETVEQLGRPPLTCILLPPPSPKHKQYSKLGPNLIILIKRECLSGYPFWGEPLRHVSPLSLIRLCSVAPCGAGGERATLSRAPRHGLCRLVFRGNRRETQDLRGPRMNHEHALANH